MLAIIIIVSVLLILFLLSLTNIKVTAKYRETLSLTIKILFWKYNIPPDKTKKKKKKVSPKKDNKKNNKKKNQKKESKGKEKDKKPNVVSKIWKKQGLSGLIDILKSMLNLAKGILKGFFKRFIIHNFDINISFVGEDAADTATGYGALCSVVYPLMGRLYNALNMEDYSVDIVCNFEENAKTEIKADMYGTIRIIFVLGILIKSAFKLIKTYFKIKFG